MNLSEDAILVTSFPGVEFAIDVTSGTTSGYSKTGNTIQLWSCDKFSARVQFEEYLKAEPAI